MDDDCIICIFVIVGIVIVSIVLGIGITFWLNTTGNEILGDLSKKIPGYDPYIIMGVISVISISTIYLFRKKIK